MRSELVADRVVTASSAAAMVHGTDLNRLLEKRTVVLLRHEDGFKILSAAVCLATVFGLSSLSRVGRLMRI